MRGMRLRLGPEFSYRPAIRSPVGEYMRYVLVAGDRIRLPAVTDVSVKVRRPELDFEDSARRVWANLFAQRERPKSPQSFVDCWSALRLPLRYSFFNAAVAAGMPRGLVPPASSQPVATRTRPGISGSGCCPARRPSTLSPA